MVEKRDPKEHLEAILGHELLDAVRVDSPIALWSVEPIQSGNHTSRVLKVFPGGGLLEVKACFGTELLAVGGIAHLGTEGKVELRLSEFHCISTSQIQPPVIFVATARTSSPVFVTAVPDITADGTDVRIVVSAWDAGGAPKPNISVAWFCRIRYTLEVPPVD